MKMTDRERQDMADLDALFTEVRHGETPQVSGALMARILADAQAASPAAVSTPVRIGWRDWLAALGGWPAMGGLVAAGVTGLWIGVAPSALIEDTVSGLIGETVPVGLFSQIDLFELETEG